MALAVIIGLILLVPDAEGNELFAVNNYLWTIIYFILYFMKIYI